MEITFAPRGILRTVWMKALVHEVGSGFSAATLSHLLADGKKRDRL